MKRLVSEISAHLKANTQHLEPVISKLKSLGVDLGSEKSKVKVEDEQTSKATFLTPGQTLEQVPFTKLKKEVLALDKNNATRPIFDLARMAKHETYRRRGSCVSSS